MEGAYIPLERLESHAAALAEELRPRGQLLPGTERRTLSLAVAALRRAERSSRQAGETGEAERWLSDNLYLAERAAGESLSAFRRTPLLRRCAEGALITSLARALLLTGGGTADEGRTLAFLRGIQRRIPLRGQELRLFPAASAAAAVELLAAEYAQPTPDPRQAEALFSFLRRLPGLELARAAEESDAVDAVLRRDPAGIYPRMDETSRRTYRVAVERLARRFHMPERAVAKRALELASKSADPRRAHVGWYLLEEPLGETPPDRSGRYILWNLLSPVLLTLAAGLYSRSLTAALLSLLPLTELCKRSADRLLLRLTPPRRVPRLELREGVPPEGKTLCVISLLLTGREAADRAVRRMEEYALANRDAGDNLLFGLLCDLPEADQVLTRAERELLSHTAAAVDKLNERRGGGFFLLTRERVWTGDTDKFGGWERKRGAMLELCRLLRERESALAVAAGNKAALRGTVYVLTLDADTRLEPETARALIGAALHPLCRPAVDPLRGVVAEGRGVLHPRIAVELSAAGRTAFARLFAPPGGAEPYPSDAREVYMDRYGSGGFAGKGLIHAETFLACLENLPERAVLSHDALEGAFLRGGYVGDVELTDGFPTGPLSYYARQHRWIRGDWQNLSWILSAGRALPALERWRLADSLRRSLVPAGELLAVCAALFARGRFCLPAALAALCLLLPWAEELLGQPFRPETDAGMRLRTRTLHGPGETLLRPLTAGLFLPAEAWCGLSAAATALWRMFIAKKRRLEWQTAEQSETARQSGLAAHYRAFWFPAALGILLLGFGGGVLSRALGALWLLTPAWCASLGRERGQKDPLSEEDRDWLLRRGAEIWRYFRDNCGADTHYLPPDNVQRSPGADRADRISPTKLGFALLSAVCARELGLAGDGETGELCSRLLTAAESMERWRGHFYNWYDTRTLCPMEPRYVSTVDSGNLCACLRAAAAGLRSHGELTLAARAEALSDMDFRLLYDERRCLFRIGIAPGEAGGDQGRYDLLESEERLTGYLAVALGQVPKKHWQHLGRARVGLRGRRGMVSWSGTMFEYLMPELFLPLYRDSHLWESARFAVFAQRQRRFGPEKVWGMSESAFAALDPSGHYRYKAHGCQTLALCRGMDREAVAAPYASFLALAAAPREAMENLRSMERAGYLGRYGFREAVDFTPGRTGGSGAAVDCFMVHHLGMSLCAIANALRDGVIRRWFFADAAMEAYGSLLQEKVPLGGPLLRLRSDGNARLRLGEEGPAREGEGTDALRPAAALLSNGAWRLLFTESGVSRGKTEGLSVYRSPSAPWERGHGVELWAEEGGERFSLLPEIGDGILWHWRFTERSASLTGERGPWRWTLTASLSPLGAGERRQLVIRREGTGEAAAGIALEPVLLPERDRRAHPSFGRLGLFARRTEKGLAIRRLPRGNRPERWLALVCDRPGDFSGDYRLPPGTGAFREAWLCEPLAAGRIPLGSERECRLTFSLAVAETEEAALRRAEEGLTGETGPGVPELLRRQWGLDQRQTELAWEELRALVRTDRAFPAEPGQGRESLWRLGVSGDRPVHVCLCAGAEGVLLARETVRRHALLRRSGLDADLVLLTEEEGDYRPAVRSEAERSLAALEETGELDAPGGVFVVSRKENEGVLRAAAALWTTPEGSSLPPRRPDHVWAAPRAENRRGTVEGRFDDEDRYVLQTGDTLPPRAWVNVLTGGGLGWLASESGAGSLWLENARECPVTPWTGDPLSAEGPERLWAETPEGPVSCFAAPGQRTKVTYSFGAVRWEKEIGSRRLCLTAFLLPEKPVRVFLLQSSESVTVSWCAPLQLAPEREDAAACALERRQEKLLAKNARCPVPDTTLTAVCSAPWLEVSLDAGAFLLGREDAGTAPGFCGRFRLEGEAVLLCGATEAEELLAPAAARQALLDTEADWRHRIGARLPRPGDDPATGPFVRGWSAWQALSGRVLGRASLYQSGGAIGFRDQLQDRVNLLDLDAPGCREHILLCCAHQYEEGDVQHWWHPGRADKGVRTRCSDDLLWLPWAACEYVSATGDESLWSETAPFLTSEPLAPGEISRYETPAPAGKGTAAEHCRRALRLALERGTGAHGLLLMGSGDWNDGYDAMGPGAESVWLTFFASLVLHRFGRFFPGEDWETQAEALGRAADSAWAGDRYIRAFYGDGTPLPGIDSLAQSFAAFNPYADPDRVRQGLDTAIKRLWDRERRLVKLCDPPVGPEDRSPGYVRTYGPGFRENGGQYTHAAVWLALALGRTGRREEGLAMLRDLLPAGRGPEYGAEPFAIAADIASAPGAELRAGWSWYTGAAAWWRRAERELSGKKFTKKL